MRVGARVPGLVDAVEDAGEPALAGAGAQKPVEAAAHLGGLDLPRVGLAHRGDLRGVEDAGLQEGQLPVEFGAVDLEGRLRHAEPGQGVPGEQALIGEVVDRQHARHPPAAPGEIGRGQGRLPVVEVQEVGRPVGVGAGGEVRRREAEAGEAQVVVAEIAVLVAVGRAVALVEVGAEQHVDPQAVGRLDQAEVAGRNPREALEAGDHRNLGERRADLPVARDQHADVVVRHQRPGQGGRDLAEAAGLHEVGHLGRGVQDAAAQRGRTGRHRYGYDAVPLAGRPLGEGTTTARIEHQH